MSFVCLVFFSLQQVVISIWLNSWRSPFSLLSNEKRKGRGGNITKETKKHTNVKIFDALIGVWFIFCYSQSIKMY